MAKTVGIDLGTTNSVIASIDVDLQFDELRGRLAERGLEIELTDEAWRMIAARGLDPADAARPLRRYIAQDVETRIGRALLTHDIADIAGIRVGARGGDLQVEFDTAGRRENASA